MDVDEFYDADQSSTHLFTDLHLYVFNNDVKATKRYIDQNKKGNLGVLSQRDIHGNTPLHLACMLGHIECAQMLVNAGVTVKIRNKQMWTPLNEAVSYGNRDLIKLILEKYIKEVKHIVNDAKPKIIHALDDMVNFYVEIKWDFESWVPFVSRFLPSDLCKLYKKGTKIRIDCTLGDFGKATAPTQQAKNGDASQQAPSQAPATPQANILNWQRGDLSFIFDLNKIGQKNSIFFLDNKRKYYSNIDKDIQEHKEDTDLDFEVNLHLSKDMFFIKSQTSNAQFIPQQIGWFTKRDRIEQCNGYMCQFYDVNSLFVVSKMRNEHLTDDDIKKNEEKEKEFRKKFQNQRQMQHQHSVTTTTGGSETNNVVATSCQVGEENGNLNEVDSYEDFDDFLGDIEYRDSLEPPPKTNVTWEEYINAKQGEWPTLGRKLRIKASQKEFKAHLAVSQEFPLSLSDLNKLLDALAPLAKFRKIKEFLTAKLPPGFPVRIEIPVVPTVTAKINFQNFKKNFTIDDNLFKIPADYVEDPDKKADHDNTDL